MAVSTDAIVKALVQHRSQLIGFAWVVVGDPQLAEDVFQDVSLAVVKKAETITDEYHLLMWLRHAIRLRALEVRRNTQGRARLLKPEVLDLLEQTPQAFAGRGNDEHVEALHACMSGLGESARQLLNMRYAQGLKSGEIASRTNRSLQAVYKSITRIHASLRECVKQRLSETRA